MHPITRCVACALVLLAGALCAQDPANLQRENAELRALVERLQGQVEVLSSRVEGLETNESAASQAAIDTAVSERIDEMVATMTPMALAQTKRGYPITWYGYIKADFALDSGRVSDGNFARWVERGGEGDSQTSITARQTRIGFDIDGPESGNIKVKGNFEIDFYNDGQENKSLPQMRHAYVTVHWKNYDFTLLAGQTWDVISPMLVPTVNYTGLWWMGDIGFRRPQFRGTKGFRINDDHRVEAVVAATRNIGGTDQFGSGDTGEDSAIPSFQGRIEYAGKVFNGLESKAGVYGHYGREEYDRVGGTEDLDSWSIGVYFDVAITDEWRFRGDGFYGSLLGTYLGATGQRLNTTNALNPEEIESIGGWVAVTWDPKYEVLQDFSFNLGVGTDDPDNDDLAANQRSSTFVVFGNAIYDIVQDTQLGLELMWLETGYFGGGADDAFRVQASVTLFF